MNRNHKIFAYYFKISFELKEDDLYRIICEAQMKNEYEIKQIKRGFRLINFDKPRYGLHNEDFIRNLYTCIVRCNIYKIPRIVKNQLLYENPIFRQRAKKVRPSAQRRTIKN